MALRYGATTPPPRCRLGDAAPEALRMTSADPLASACPRCNHQPRSHQPLNPPTTDPRTGEAIRLWCMTCGESGPCAKPDGISLEDRQRIARRMIG